MNIYGEHSPVIEFLLQFICQSGFDILLFGPYFLVSVFAEFGGDETSGDDSNGGYGVVILDIQEVFTSVDDFVFQARAHGTLFVIAGLNDLGVQIDGADRHVDGINTLDEGNEKLPAGFEVFSGPAKGPTQSLLIIINRPEGEQFG